LAAIIFAGAFTEFYPDCAMGESTSWARIIDRLPPFVLVTGIVGSAMMRRFSRSETEAAEPQ